MSFKHRNVSNMPTDEYRVYVNYRRKLTRIAALRIKRKTLVAETAIIREEIKSAHKRGVYGWDLQHHLDTVVSPAARSNHLAHCYLVGTPYKAAEATCRKEPNWKEIAKIAARFSPNRRLDTEAFEAWKNGTEATKEAA